MGFARMLASRIAFVCCVCWLMPCGFAQRPAAEATVPALMVSDIHFEPFWDPAKAAQLAAAPAVEWRAILAAPDSPDRAQQFADLQNSCHSKGLDTNFLLLQSSLEAMRADASAARFITVSGDLIAHNFNCKFQAVFPHASTSDYQRFVAKTIAFVGTELRGALPRAALYLALGNNDSDCGDYRLNENGTLLSDVALPIAAGLDVPGADRGEALRALRHGGDYNVPLPAPIRNGRMVVLDDIFMSTKYAMCSGAPGRKAAADQIAWLRDQLVAARRNRQNVWVMAHIPPGVDPYSTARKMRDLCGGEPAETFLASDELASTLAEFGDVIKLAIFAHTHMDELRLLETAGGASAAHPAVAVKMVSSISPVDGNNPSFTVAQVDAANAELADYQVYAASNQSGVNTTWSKEYDFDATYHQPAFTAATVAAVVHGFYADRKAENPASESYLRNYFVGDKSVFLRPFWPEYVCALTNRTSQSYRSCVCAPQR